MTKRAATFAGFLLLLFVLPWPATAAQAQGADAMNPADQKAIQAVLDAQIVAWNRGDIEGFMDGYWRSPDLIYIGNTRVVQGWDALLDLYRKNFQGSNSTKMGTLELTDEHFTPLGRDSALVWGVFRVVTADGKERGGLYTLAMRKLKEGWRTVYDRTSTTAAGQTSQH